MAIIYEKKTVRKSGRTYIYYYEVTPTGRVKISSEEFAAGRSATTKIVGKSGKVTKAGQDYINQLRRDFESGEISSEDYYLQTSIIRKSTAQKKPRTAAQVRAIASQNKLATALANTGLTPEALARSIGVNASDLLNPKKWNQKTHYGKSRRGNTYIYTTMGDIFTDPATGMQYKLIYVYNGDTHFEPIGA